MLPVLCVLGSLALPAGAGPSEPLQSAIEWHRIPWSGGVLDVAVVPPVPPVGAGSTPAPLILALPWGSGSPELVESFVRSYWLSEPAARGYWVVAPAVRGPTLGDAASDAIPAIFSWMERELRFDERRVALVGASNGGRGMFFAALAEPSRFAALLGLPGSFGGDPADLAALAGTPVRLLVGEHDDGWVAASEATAAALSARGVEVTLDVVPGEGHVMRLDPRTLVDWLDRALAR